MTPDRPSMRANATENAATDQAWTAPGGEVPRGWSQGGRDLSGLLAAQRAAFAENPPRYAERLDALSALEGALMRRQRDIAAAISEDFGGRAIEETLALELF